MRGLIAFVLRLLVVPMFALNRAIDLTRTIALAHFRVRRRRPRTARFRDSRAYLHHGNTEARKIFFGSFPRVEASLKALARAGATKIKSSRSVIPCFRGERNARA